MRLAVALLLSCFLPSQLRSCFCESDELFREPESPTSHMCIMHTIYQSKSTKIMSNACRRPHGVARERDMERETEGVGEGGRERERECVSVRESEQEKNGKKERENRKRERERERERARERELRRFGSTPTSREHQSSTALGTQRTCSLTALYSFNWVLKDTLLIFVTVSPPVYFQGSKVA